MQGYLCKLFVLSANCAMFISYIKLDCGNIQIYMFHALTAKTFVMLDGNVDFLLQDFDVSKKKLKVDHQKGDNGKLNIDPWQENKYL